MKKSVEVHKQCNVIKGSLNKREKTFSHKSTRGNSLIIYLFTQIFFLEPHTGTSSSSTI